jgi:lysophospholipase L1-like esterase
MKRARFAVRVLAGIVAIIAVTEAGVRLGGLVDFPLYDVDPEIGYVVKPNQHGVFMTTNDWVFNDRSMGVGAAWKPTGKTDVLLLGNSIIAGGNPFKEREKVGPLVQARLGPTFAVWPIASGGWSALNQMVYLQRNPDVLPGSDVIVWEYMNGALSQRTEWAGEYVWPTERPLWAGWYVFRRYALPRLSALGGRWLNSWTALPSELPPAGRVTPENMRRFESVLDAADPSKRRILLMYPIAAALIPGADQSRWTSDYPQVEAAARARGWKVVDVEKDPRWGLQRYRPDHVHPTAQGNTVLADIIADAVREK